MSKKKKKSLQRSFERFCAAEGAGYAFPLGAVSSPQGGVNDPCSFSCVLQTGRTWYEQEKCMFLLVMLSAINFLLTRLTGQSLRNRKLLLFCYGFAWPACQTDRSRSKTSYKQSCLPLDILLLLRGCV